MKHKYWKLTIKNIKLEKETQKNLEATVQVRNSTNEGIKITKKCQKLRKNKKIIKGHIK